MKPKKETKTLEEVFKNQQIIIEKKDSEIFYLKSIIENLPGSIYCKDNNGVYLYRNHESAESMRRFNFPWQWEEIVGKTDHDLFPKEVADKFQKNDLDVMNSGKELIKEEIITLPSGQKAIQLSRKKPLLDRNGKTVGIIGNTLDITYLKKIESELRETKDKAEAANQAKTEFLENMRHDIRTPLGGITSLLRILKDEKDVDKIKGYTTQLAEASQELFRFLNEILESINVASGEIPLLKKKFNLKTILENVIKLQQPKVHEKQLKLEFYFDELIPKYLMGDPVRIYRILLELIVNALKFTDQGHINVSTKLAKKEGRDLVIEIVVEDTGPGIPTEKRQELFARFKRLTSSYQGIYKGSGLGLSIIKQFIDELKGEIYCADNEGKGAKFIVLIPVNQSLLENDLGETDYNNVLALDSYSPSMKTKPNQLNPMIKELPPNPKQKAYVLIVEDHPLMANIAEELLTKLDCKVEVAENGKTAIDMANQNGYDLIFMDIGLPDIDGYEVTKHIRSKHRMPIIGLTAHAETEKKQQGMDAGMNLIMNKPLLKETAVGILQDFLFKDFSKEQGLISEEGTKLTSYVKNDQVIDLKAVETIWNNDQELLVKALNTIIDNLEEESVKLDIAHSNQDWKTIGDIAHKLNGISCYCMASRLKEACRQLENSISKMDAGLKEKQYQQMRSEMQTLKLHIESNRDLA